MISRKFFGKLYFLIRESIKNNKYLSDDKFDNYLCDLSDAFFKIEDNWLYLEGYIHE